MYANNNNNNNNSGNDGDDNDERVRTGNCNKNNDK